MPTIRVYEGKGLLPRPFRTAGNQRRYDESALNRLRFIRHTRDPGLPLADFESLLTPEGTTGEDLNRAHDIAERQLTDIQNRIERLRQLEAEPERITKACDG